MGSKLVDAGATLGVEGDDLKEFGRQRRRDTLSRIAQALTLIASPVLGIYAAEAAYPLHESPLWNNYPFIPLMLASSKRTYFGRRSWTGPIILSVALFVVSFLFVATFNSAHNDNYGMSSKYSVFSAGVEARR